MAKNVIKAWLADNTVTTDDKNDKIFIVETGQTYDLDDIVDLLHQQESGLRQETILHVVKLYNRVVAELLLNGNNVNAGLFYAVPKLRGTAMGGKWDPEHNSIYVSFTRGADLRKSIAETMVEILGEKANVMYILEIEDRDTGLKDGTVTAGRGVFVRGASLKVVGDDPSVGITLTPAEGEPIKLAANDIFVNNPSELLLILPTGLEDGTYTLTITTQYSRSSSGTLKTPRSVSKTVFVGGIDDPEQDGGTPGGV